MISWFQSKQNKIENGTLSYVVFDVNKYKEKTVTRLPLIEMGAAAGGEYHRG